MTTEEAAVQAFLAADYGLSQTYFVPKALRDIDAAGIPHGWTADLLENGSIRVRPLSPA